MTKWFASILRLFDICSKIWIYLGLEKMSFEKDYDMEIVEVIFLNP